MPLILSLITYVVVDTLFVVSLHFLHYVVGEYIYTPICSYVPARLGGGDVLLFELPQKSTKPLVHMVDAVLLFRNSV